MRNSELELFMLKFLAHLSECGANLAVQSALETAIEQTWPQTANECKACGTRNIGPGWTYCEDCIK